MSAPVEVVLVRHGESTGNVARERAEQAGSDVIDTGGRDADVPLSELGCRQAAALGDALRPVPFRTVWSSPYRRATQTAALAAPGADVRLDERLRDRELGVLDGLTGRGVARRYPDEAVRRRRLGKFYYRPPGGESWADVALRVRSWLRDADLGRGSHLVVSHDAVILLLRYVCEGLDERRLLDLAATSSVGNAGITRLQRDAGRWHAVAVDDRSHLGGLSTDHAAERPDVPAR